MNAYRALAAVALLTVGLVYASGCVSSQSADTAVVASGSGFSVTLAEVDAEVRERLFQEKTRGGNAAMVYELRAEALDSMIQNHVLATESTSRNVTVDELLASETPAVTDEEVEAFYETNRERMQGASLEDIADRIRGFLGQQKQGETVATLVEAASIEVSLERPRFEVEPIGPSRGPTDAPITIVEFSDFQCPFCSRAVPIVNELLSRHPDDIRLVYRHLPLESIHPRARDAAVASACAEDQDKFWAFHDGLFANPGQFGDEDFARVSTEAGLDAEAFSACYAARTPEPRVDADIEAARAAGVTSTPAFLVNGILMKGAQPVEAFEQVIASELAQGRTAAP
jgi:predicted DsbA family dithiol-disulfide isomerase